MIDLARDQGVGADQHPTRGDEPAKRRRVAHGALIAQP